MNSLPTLEDEVEEVSDLEITQPTKTYQLVRDVEKGEVVAGDLAL